jgi:hypothetical protein
MARWLPSRLDAAIVPRGTRRRQEWKYLPAIEKFLEGLGDEGAAVVGLQDQRRAVLEEQGLGGLDGGVGIGLDGWAGLQLQGTGCARWSGMALITAASRR